MVEKYGAKAGEIKIAEEPDKLVALGLGSCVAITLYDPEEKIGGLAHAMLPKNRGSTKQPGKYVDTAVDKLVEKLEERGAKKKPRGEGSRGVKHVFTFQ